MKKYLLLLLLAMVSGCSADEGPVGGGDDKKDDDKETPSDNWTYWTDDSAKPGLQVRGNDTPSFYLGSEKYYETGINCYDLFLISITNTGTGHAFDTSPSFDILKAMKRNRIPVARFSCCVYYADDLAAYTNDKKGYLASLERIVARAEELQIGLIPSIIWQYRAIPDYVGEGTRAWGRADSKTIAFMKEYVRDVVERLSKYKSIYAWEFGNELNLDADLPNWQQIFETTDPEYRFTGQDLKFAFETFIDVVQASDPHGRAIISGHANLRNSQYNQYAFGTWTTDSTSEYKTITEILTPEGMECSEHIYELSRSFSDSGTIGLDDRLRIARQTAESLGKTYIVGEFGAASNEGYSTYYDALLRNGIQLSLVWNFSITGVIEHSFTADSERGKLLFSLIPAYNKRFREVYGQ